MCLKWDRLSSPAGSLPGKILTVGLHAASYKPKHVYLFLQLKKSPHLSPTLSFPLSLSLSLTFMGISMEFFCNVSDCVGWGSHTRGCDAFPRRWKGLKRSLLCYFAMFFLWTLPPLVMTRKHLDATRAVSNSYWCTIIKTASKHLCTGLCNRWSSNNKANEPACRLSSCFYCHVFE